MNVLTQLTIRNLKLNRKRTIVTLIGIILSGAMICGVAAIIASFQSALIEDTKQTSGSHHVSFYDVPSENSHLIKDHAFTETAMFSRDVGYAQWDKITNQQKQYLYVKAYDTNAFEHFPVTLVEGRYPENPNEIVISSTLLNSGGSNYEIGETFTVNIVNPRLENDAAENTTGTELDSLEIVETATYTITGWIEPPRNEYYNSPYLALTFLDTETLSAGESVNISIIGKKAKKLFDIVPEMSESAGAGEIVYNNDLLRLMGLTQNDYIKETMYLIAFIVILLIVIGSVTVIYNAFAISVSERKKQFGMLSSVGATQRQIRKMVFMEGIVLALIGIPIGILSGYVGIGVTLGVINRIMAGSMFASDVPLQLVVNVETIIISIIFISLTIFLSAYIPAKKAARITPIEAIRLNTDINIKGKKLKTSKLTRMLFGIEGDLARKNLKRNRKRYRATVFSLFISIVLYISFSSFMSYSMMSGNMYYEGFDYDFSVNKVNFPMDEKMQFFEQIVALEEVEHFSIQRSLRQTTTVDPEQLGSFITKRLEADDERISGYFQRNDDGTYPFYINLVSVGEQEFQHYAKKLGLDVSSYKNTDEPRGILVNHNRIEYPVLSDYEPLNIKPGESLEVSEYAYDDFEPYQFTLEIAAVAEEAPFAVRYTGVNYVKIIVSEPVFDHLLNKQNGETESINDNTDLYFNVKEGTDRAKLFEQIKQMDESLQSARPAWITDTLVLQEEMKRSVTVMSIFFYGFISLITLIGITNIFNTISTNVALRRREFAMLKSVGLTPSGFNKMMNFESIFYGLKSLLYGLPVGILVSIWMYNSINRSFSFAFVLPWKEIAVCVAGVFIVVFLTMLHSSSKLKKENIIDALKEENL